MASKHFLNDPSHLVISALRSLTILNPAVDFDEKYKIVHIKQTRTPQVSVISGGGSGHEPSFGAFVGGGFLSGAIAGSVFASPSTEQIYKCLTNCVDTSKGVMVVIMNYTGDVLHFGMAVEKARARGLKVDMLVVGDDVGVGRAKGGRIGRRGIAGTTLVQKIASSAAASGASLEEVLKIASLSSANLVSVGASLSHVHVPGRAPVPDDFDKSKDVELGMGIHNEEGFKRLKTDLPGLVTAMLAQLLDTADSDRGYINVNNSDSIVLLVNNLGGVSVLELSAITEEVCKQLKTGYDFKPVRVLAGTFMSSLNGLGFSISILKLVDTGFHMSLLELLDAPTEAIGWSAAVSRDTWSSNHASTRSIADETEEELLSSNLTLNSSQVVTALKAGLKRLIVEEPKITEFDTLVGDGDCGICLRTGAEAIVAEIEKQREWTDAVKVVGTIARTVEASMDGTSGAIFAIFLNSLAYSLSVEDSTQKTPADVGIWAKALKGALASLSRYTPAKIGDRTLVDALQPFVEVMIESQDMAKAVAAAVMGMEATKGMEASLGRSVYVGGDNFQKCPDPGAYGLVQFLLGFSSAL